MLKFLHVSFALLPCFLFTGCLPEFFSNPPTGPSRSNNTWLLGVWEMPKLSAENGTWQGTYRATLSPTNSNRLALILEDRGPDGRTLRQVQGQAWISHVGQATFLVAEFAPGSHPLTFDWTQPKYLVVGYQLLDPLTVRVRELSLPPEAYQASRFQLRILIREAFRNGTLFQAREQLWKKIGEIYWQRGGNPASDTFTPPRYLAPPAPSPTPGGGTPGAGG